MQDRKKKSEGGEGGCRGGGKGVVCVRQVLVINILRYLLLFFLDICIVCLLPLLVGRCKGFVHQKNV